MNIPDATDEAASDETDCIERVIEICVQWTQESPLVPIAVLRGIEVTLLNGRVSMTPVSLVCWGWLQAQMGDFEEADRFGKIGLHYARQGRGGKHDFRAIGLHHFYIDHWRRPIHESLEPFIQVFAGYWELGKIENVLWDTGTYLVTYYCTGLPLEPLSRDISKYAKLMLDYGHLMNLGNQVPFFQMVANLMGRSEDPLVLTGEYMDQEEKLAEWKRTDHQFVACFYYLFRMMLAYIFGDFELAGVMGGKMGNLYVEGPSPWVAYRFLFRGLTGFARYSTSRKRSHLGIGNTSIKQFEKWTKDGVINCRHMLLLLKAEKLAVLCKAHPKKVQIAYDEVISVTARLGFLDSHAIAIERLGVYFLAQEDTYNASNYLGRAREAYRRWGADGKVKQLQVKYQGLLDDDDTGAQGISSNLKGRARLGDYSKEVHQNLILPF
jgi:hypothetical protein